MVVVQCTYTPTLVHKLHGTLNQHSSLNHYISLNQHSFGFGTLHLCTSFGAMPYTPTLVHKWHGTLNQHSSLNYTISLNQHSFGFGAMHQLWCNTTMHQLWCTNVMVLFILTLLFGYPDIHFLV